MSETTSQTTDGPGVWNYNNLGTSNGEDLDALRSRPRSLPQFDYNVTANSTPATMHLMDYFPVDGYAEGIESFLWELSPLPGKFSRSGADASHAKDALNVLITTGNLDAQL